VDARPPPGAAERDLAVVGAMPVGDSVGDPTCPSGRTLLVGEVGAAQGRAAEGEARRCVDPWRRL